MKICYNVTTKDLSIVEDDTFFYNYFCFADDENSGVVFDNLSFGITIKEGNKIIVQEEYPQNGIEYLSTDQEVLETVPSGQLLRNKDYYYHVWVENGGERVEDSFVKHVPKTEQNYPSWSWSDENQRWEPPIPYPDPRFYYDWDEDNQQWVLIEINNPE